MLAYNLKNMCKIITKPALFTLYHHDNRMEKIKLSLLTARPIRHISAYFLCTGLHIKTADISAMH